MFHSADTLVGDEVGQTLLQSGGLERTVEVNEQMVLCTRSGSPLVKIHHPLVAVVHEVNLQSLYAHLGIIGNEVCMPFNGKPGKP